MHPKISPWNPTSKFQEERRSLPFRGLSKGKTIPWDPAAVHKRRRTLVTYLKCSLANGVKFCDGNKPPEKTTKIF
jgi:hypothetical protein